MENDSLGNTTVLNIDSGDAIKWSHIELYFRHRLFRVEDKDLPFLIGRDIECDLPVQSDYASRNHCVIDKHEGQIGLFDRSTNGTFVDLGRADTVVIRGDFCPLTGQGRFSLGERIDIVDPNIIMFKVFNKHVENT